MAEYKRAANGLEVIGGTNVYVQQMTQAEYDDMSQAQQDDNHFRVITDSDEGEPGLQASEISTSDGSNVQDVISPLPSECGVGRTTGSTRTITLNGSYTAMDYCFLQIQWGSYPGSFVITSPITFTAPKTISFSITDSQGTSASAQYDVAYMFKGH